MGRGVATLSDYSELIYLTYEGNLSYDDDEAQDDWDDFVSNIVAIIQGRLPSMEGPYRNKWDGDEVKIILENSLAEVGISEYCGVVSLAIRPHYDVEDSKRGLQEKWIASVWPGIEKALGESFPSSVLNYLGTMSNGESVYRRVA
jgi:hypothetical protein